MSPRLTLAEYHTPSAAEFAALLVEASESWHEGRITFAVYRARQIDNWNAITLAGLDGAVLAILRDAACGPAL